MIELLEFILLIIKSSIKWVSANLWTLPLVAGILVWGYVINEGKK